MKTKTKPTRKKDESWASVFQLSIILTFIFGVLAIGLFIIDLVIIEGIYCDYDSNIKGISIIFLLLFFVSGFIMMGIGMSMEDNNRKK